MRQYFALLANTPLFVGCDVAALLGAKAVPEPFARDAVLYGPTGHVPQLTFLLKGSALVYKLGGAHHRLLMSRLLPGQAFGMASLFYEAAFPTEVCAEKAGLLLRWPRAEVEAAIARDAQLSHNYIALLSERIHFLNRRIDALSGDDLRTRLLSTLDGLRGDAQDAEGFTLPFSLSQMAELMGIGRASLYRTLDALEAEGLLRREGKRIIDYAGPDRIKDTNGGNQE